MVPGKFQQALPLFAPSRSQTRCPLKVSRQLSRTGIKRSHHSLVHARRQTSFPKQLSQNLRIKKLHTFRLLNSERARVTNTTHTPTSVEMRTPGFTQEAKGTRSGAHRTEWKSNCFPYRVAKFSSISLGATLSLSLSFNRWCRETSPIERNVVPPNFSARVQQYHRS